MMRSAAARQGSEEMARAADRLVAEFAPCAVYLFGSRVIGRARPDSDIDILVVLEDDSAWLSELGRRGYGAVRDLHLPIELHFRSRERFGRWSEVSGSFEEQVRTHGIPLYVAER